MSTLWDGFDDQMVYALPASSPASGPNISFGTFLIVARILQANGSWMSFLETELSGGTLKAAFGRHSNNSIYLYNGVAISENGAQTITSADNWAVYAVTKATGTAAPTLIKCPIGGSVASVAGTVSQANFADSSGGNLRLGGNDDFANMRVAAVAAFQGILLTTTEVQSVADTKTTQKLADLGATWLADDNDAFLTDLIGAVDRTSITGTADDADDPAGWVYGLGGGTPERALPPLVYSQAVQRAALWCQHVKDQTRDRVWLPGPAVN